MTVSYTHLKAHGFDFFTTTLSISPLKNAEKLNQIGAELADTFDVRYLFSDFTKKEGYKKSTEISKAVSYTHLAGLLPGVEFPRRAAFL